VPQIRVLIVDDSAVVRHLLSDVLMSDPEITVAGTAPNGSLALVRIPDAKPDLVTLDVEMPGMDGIGTLIEIRKLYPRLPVIMFSTLTGPGAAATVEALARGASDYASKPTQAGSTELARERVRQELIPKIKALCVQPKQVPQGSAFVRPPDALTARSVSRVDLVAIGSSTGGPNALAEVIPQFPADFPAPIVIVQHMPAMFTRLLAQRLDGLAPLRVLEGADGQKLEKGQVLIAPGDYHMTVVRKGNDRVLSLNQGPAENSCRPAVDVLFRSVAQSCGANVLAAVLTGMGCDGTKGAVEIRGAGGSVIAQDEASSVVWGMPGSVVAAGLANRVCSLRDVPFEILRRAAVGRSAMGAARS
jgi:two-component system, chemotaxis family, protein-glutamate methylesterase/glutaminase